MLKVKEFCFLLEIFDDIFVQLSLSAMSLLLSEVLCGPVCSIWLLFF